jgi:hypothetical protein
MGYHSTEELIEKLIKSEDPLKQIYEWVKTHHIDLKTFRALVDWWERL